MSEPNMSPEDARFSVVDKINLAFGLLAIVLLAGALGLTYVPETSLSFLSRDSRFALSGNLRLAGLVAMGLYVVTLLMLKEREVAQFLKHRHTHSGANIGVQVVAIIAILSAVNYFGTRHHARIDLTENKAYSLSEQSLKVIKDLKEPVTVELFIRKGEPQSTNLETLWSQYAYASDKVKLEIIDIDRNPTRARQNKITAYGSSVVSRGTQTTTLTGSQEQDLTSAIIKVTREGQKTVYFTTGHGEASYEKFDKEGATQLKDAIEKQMYKVDKLALFTAGKVPTDASVVIVLGPTKPFAPKELDALKTYIRGGGRAIVCATPQAEDNLNDLTKEFGIEIRNDLVIDPASNLFGEVAVPVVQRFPYHAITQSLQAAYFPGSRSLVKVATMPTGVSAISPLAETTPEAWGETNIKGRNLQFDAGKDTKGPLQLMMVSELGSKGRLIVSGNTMFATNAAFSQINNGDLFLAGMNWASGEDSLVSIPPKDPANKQLNLQPAQFYGIFAAAVGLFPALLLLAAAFVWWRRR
ncbi:MAG: Gldg family protein [Candidatus Sericytochromatia bacterium]|nr:Gldg family protein [Candidatus Sericytochromatia bacterium]